MNNRNPLNALFDDRSKGRKKRDIHEIQAGKFYQYLLANVATCSMVCRATNIPQKNATWYKKWLCEAGRMWIVKIDYCKDTGYQAAYLTADPKQVPHIPKTIPLF
jgi:hypothetical protein